jgi:hypothetical protein
MFNWDKAVDSHFDKKQDSKNELESLFESLLNQLKVELLSEGEKKDTNTEDAQGKFKLPTVKISQAWGKPETGDRERLSRFMRNIEGQTLEDKIRFINDILQGKTIDNKNVEQIISVMMFSELMSGIINEFDSRTAGHLFEAFVAGLFGGQSRQLSDNSIVDIVSDDGQFYSLKLLQKAGAITSGGNLSKGSEIKGSFQNLITFFKNNLRNGIDAPVHYLIAGKDGNRITLGQFSMSLDNFLDVFFYSRSEDPKHYSRKSTGASMVKTPAKIFSKQQLKEFLKEPKAIYYIYAPNVSGNKYIFGTRDNTKPDLSDNLDWGRLFDEASANAKKDSNEPILSIKYGEYEYERTSYISVEDIFLPRQLKTGNRQATTSDQKEEVQNHLEVISSLLDQGDLETLINYLEQLPGYKEKQQFYITQEEMQNISNFSKIGEFDVSEEALKQLWTNYANLLNETVAPLYRVFDKFSTSIENYITSPASVEQGTRKSYGDEAITSSQQLAVETSKTVESLEKHRKENT